VAFALGLIGATNCTMYVSMSRKRYTSSQVRERFADFLDSAERGESVVIERRGVRFVLQAVSSKPRRTTRPSVIESLDPTVEEGQWTWKWTHKSLRFAKRTPSR
jgi:antitoxin (DNA-binding transcriptional repressor) of toxin-antitoxin stability system